MSNKLDQSLDTIMTDSRKANSSRRRSARQHKKAKAAPVGGIQKTAKPAKQSKATALPGASKPAEGKVMISSIPQDVTERDLQEYLRQQVGPTKNVMINYGPNGKSRGVAIVTFHKPEDSGKALSILNGLKIDNKPIKVEILVDAQHAPAPAPAKTLNDRISKPKAEKDKPKPATADKDSAAKKGGRTRGAARGRGGRKGATTRKQPRTMEELDQEMTDYWNTNNPGGDAPAATSGGAVQPVAANGDANMDDEIM